MKKKLILALCVTISMTSSVKAFEMKAPNMSSMKNVTSTVSHAAASLSPSSVKGTVSSINTKLIAADTTVQTALSSLVAALSSKKDAAQYKAKLTAINSNKNLSASEKSAKIAQIMSDYGTTLKENKEELGNKIKNASATKRTEITNAVVALAVASFQYVDIANDCKNIVMSISTNPTLAISCANELSSLKETASILKNNIKSLKNVTTQAIEVAKIGGLEIKLPKPRVSKAKKANI